MSFILIFKLLVNIGTFLTLLHFIDTHSKLHSRTIMALLLAGVIVDLAYILS